MRAIYMAKRGRKEEGDTRTGKAGKSELSVPNEAMLTFITVSSMEKMLRKDL